MNVLVTGGAGFIGSNLTAELLRIGHKVTVLDSLESGYLENIEPLPIAAFVKGDVRDAALINSTMKDIDYVFHLAASVGNKKSIDFPVVDAEINVIGTINVLESARRNGIQKVVFSSSAGTFGELKSLPIAVDHPTYPDTPYGCSKLYAEKLCGSYTHLYGLQTAALRYFNVYGQNQRFDAYGNVIPIFVHKMLQDELITIFGDGEQTRDFVHVDDVVQANVKAAFTDGAIGAFNIGSGTQLTVNRLVELLKEVSGLNTSVEHGPERPGDVRDSLADISHATKQFGFVPSVSFETGLQQYWQWAKSDRVRR